MSTQHNTNQRVEMIKIALLSLTILLFLGCSQEKMPLHEPRVTDVSLKVEGDKVSSVKKYDNNMSTVQTISASSKPLQKRPYEKVPDFTQNKHTASHGRKREKKAKPIYISGKKKVQISVEGIPLNEFIDVVFSQVLKQNYTMTQEVRNLKTPITLNMLQKRSKQQVFNVVTKILQMNSVAIEKDNGVLFFSKKQGSSTISNTGMYIGYGRTVPKKLHNSEKIGMFIPIYYTKLINIQSLIRSIGMGRIQFSKIQKDLIFTVATVEQVKKIIEIVDMLDRPSLTDKETVLISLKNSDAAAFTTQIQKIFRLNGIPIAQSVVDQGVILEPIEEIQSLLVVAANPKWIDTILYWKKKLDVPSELGDEPRLYLYHVQNRRADELADAVNDMLGLAVTTKNKKTTTKNIAGTKTPVQKKKVTTSRPVSAGTLIESVDYTPSVSADVTTNILMLKLKPKHYKILLPIIKQLDILPLQTLVEVTIAEVDMTDTFSLGFEWALTNKGSGLADLVNVVGGGSGLGIIFQGNKINMTVNALAEDKLLDIVSKPKLLILNNETGHINVGTQVPIITSETSASDIPSGSINRNVSYRTTGVTMGVTPTINSEGILTMNIDLSLSEAQLNDTSAIDSPLIVDRKLSTVAVIKSGDTIMIGGLISKNLSTADSGVPLLKDIPWLGSIFKSQSQKTVKTELIMLIRPTIINSPEHIEEETRKFKAVLKHLNYL